MGSASLILSTFLSFPPLFLPLHLVPFNNMLDWLQHAADVPSSFLHSLSVNSPRTFTYICSYAVHKGFHHEVLKMINFCVQSSSYYICIACQPICVAWCHGRITKINDSLAISNPRCIEFWVLIFQIGLFLWFLFHRKGCCPVLLIWLTFVCLAIVLSLTQSEDRSSLPPSMWVLLSWRRYWVLRWLGSKTHPVGAIFWG